MLTIVINEWTNYLYLETWYQRDNASHFEGCLSVVVQTRHSKAAQVA